MQKHSNACLTQRATDKGPRELRIFCNAAGPRRIRRAGEMLAGERKGTPGNFLGRQKGRSFPLTHSNKRRARFPLPSPTRPSPRSGARSLLTPEGPDEEAAVLDQLLDELVGPLQLHLVAFQPFPEIRTVQVGVAELERRQPHGSGKRSGGDPRCQPGRRREARRGRGSQERAESPPLRAKLRSAARYMVEPSGHRGRPGPSALRSADSPSGRSGLSRPFPRSCQPQLNGSRSCPGQENSPPRSTGRHAAQAGRQARREGKKAAHRPLRPNQRASPLLRIPTPLRFSTAPCTPPPKRILPAGLKGPHAPPGQITQNKGDLQIGNSFSLFASCCTLYCVLLSVYMDPVATKSRPSTRKRHTFLVGPINRAAFKLW